MKHVNYNKELQDKEPCMHTGCLNHNKHPCEKCGRTGARGNISMLNVYSPAKLRVYTERSFTFQVEGIY